MNVAGNTLSIEYIAPDKSQWSASLQKIKQCTVLGVPRPECIIDPDFIHSHVAPPETHSDEWISYITLDGSPWFSKCHAHFAGTSGGSILATFSFEHFRASDLEHAHHESGEIVFTAWDGTVWLGTVPLVWVPPGGEVQPGFDLQKVK